MIGSTLGHYRIVARLGRGGMGEVFEAEDEKLKRRVALKLLAPGLAPDEERRRRFQREAETIASLNHPNIVTLFSIEHDDERQFLTMEKVEGEGLDEILGRGPLPLERIFEIAIPMADALSAAHARDVVHRDLKPANVMITREGRVKILDFGLAKLADEAATGLDEATVALTREGMVLGTVPYMSPEQVQGKPVDRRTDIFSLGVILYEMATGRRPFGGESSAELISSILRDQPVAVSELDTGLPHHLGRIIRHCLEKDPARRYQSALDVRNELEDLRREVESGVVPTETMALPAGGPRRRPRWLLAATLGGALLVAALALWRLLAAGGEPPAPPVAARDPAVQSSVAVLFFDNLSGDPELDWLRSGLTDMLVTDLSQLPAVRVLSTDRVFQILSDLGKLDERITSFEVVREVASRGQADTVILGSYAKIGDTIQISIKIQEAATGEILEADSVRARGQDEIFARVDDLSRNIRRSIELPDAPAAIVDRGIAEVTTDSVEAYRYFVEAENLHYQSKELEAIELYRKAVEVDPAFALAWAKLGTTHSNLGMLAEANRYTEKAIEHVERLTEPERAYVEGRYYGRRLETVGRAIEIYRDTLARYPHLTALANNLAVLYSGLWLHDEAIASFEQAIAYGDSFAGTYGGLAQAYLATGDGRRAIQVLEGFLAEKPESFTTYPVLAMVHGWLGNSEAARRALERADELRPGFISNLIGWFSYGMATGDLEVARAQLPRLRSLPFPYAESTALGFEAALLIYEGRTAEAMRLGERSVAAYPEPGPGRAQSRIGLAAGYLALERPAEALVHLRAAREEDPGHVGDYVSHGLEALAYQLQGDAGRADRVLAEFGARTAAIPGPLFDWLGHEIAGSVQLLRGDAAAAIERLEAGAALQPEYLPTATRLWMTLAEAYLEAGRPADAERLLERILGFPPGRVFQPAEFVLAHYRLGRIHEERGDVERAGALYRAFVGYWGEGDVARDSVERARRFLAARSG